MENMMSKSKAMQLALQVQGTYYLARFMVENFNMFEVHGFFVEELMPVVDRVCEVLKSGE